MTRREALCRMGYDDAIVFENPDYDSAIIGVTSDGRVVYDYNLMVLDLAREDDISISDAIEFIDYNTLYSSGVAGYPLVMYPLDYEGDEDEKD